MCFFFPASVCQCGKGHGSFSNVKTLLNVKQLLNVKLLNIKTMLAALRSVQILNQCVFRSLLNSVCVFVFVHNWDWSVVSFLAQLTFIEFLLPFYTLSVIWQADCLFDCILCGSKQASHSVPFWEMWYFTILWTILTSGDLKCWFKFFWDQIGWFCYLGSSLKFT